MRRTLEKLAEDRRSREEDIARRLEAIRTGIGGGAETESSGRLAGALDRLEKLSRSLGAPPAGSKKRLFGLKRAGAPEEFIGQTAAALKEIASLLESHVLETRESLKSVLDLVSKVAELSDSRDREWDALGSNHVGMIFKSMEWRVEKLAAEYEDVQILMKKFYLIRDKLDALIAALEKGGKPAPADVRAVLEPIEDWRYAGFENRFRGSENEIRKQQAGYIPLFRKGGRVLDLGCGRGEFLDLLRENGISGEGVDLNSQMIDICTDRGLDCRKEDILERLAEEPDGALDGIFSSQVIEHLPPDYLKKLIETARVKLAPGGVAVFETVNPVSVFALVQIYFLDPTHRNPVHPRALQFMLESTGFADVEIRYSAPLAAERLREFPGADEQTSVMNANVDRLNDLLFAPPNYAAIGRKR
jgi:SAM-dependent methyltransferase